MGKLSAKNSDVLNSKSVVLTQPSTSTNHLVFKRDLVIFHRNIRGISNKTDQILNTVVTNPPHVTLFYRTSLKNV